MTCDTETRGLASQARNKLAAAQTRMNRSMLTMTYQDKSSDIWIREKTKVVDVTELVMHGSRQGPVTSI